MNTNSLSAANSTRSNLQDVSDVLIRELSEFLNVTLECFRRHGTDTSSVCSLVCGQLDCAAPFEMQIEGNVVISVGDKPPPTIYAHLLLFSWGDRLGLSRHAGKSFLDCRYDGDRGWYKYTWTTDDEEYYEHVLTVSPSEYSGFEETWDVAPEFVLKPQHGLGQRGDRGDGSLSFVSPSSFDPLFPVSSRGKYGFIDEMGNIAIELRFDDAGAFVNGVAPVKIAGKWREINTNGQVREERGAGPVREKWPELLRPSDSDLVVVQRHLPDDCRYGFADQADETIVVPTIYDDVRPFFEGLAAVCQSEKWGFIDKSGQVVVELVYDDVRNYINGLAAACLDQRWGYLDLTGRLAIPLKFDDAKDFFHGVARVAVARRWGYIDAHGEFIWVPESCTHFESKDQRGMDDDSDHS